MVCGITLNYLTASQAHEVSQGRGLIFMTAHTALTAMASLLFFVHRQYFCLEYCNTSISLNYLLGFVFLVVVTLKKKKRT